MMTQEKNKKWFGRAAVVGLIVLGIFAFRYFDLGQYLSLDYIKSSQEQFHALYQSHRLAVIAAYMGIYIVVTALSLPGAAVMTLAGGGLFGLLVGTVAVSFASTIGATLACFVSRFLSSTCSWGSPACGCRLFSGYHRSGCCPVPWFTLMPARN